MVCFFMAMQKAIEETLAPKIGKLIPPDVGKAEAVETIRKTVDGQRPHKLNAWVEARRHLPTFERKTEHPESRKGGSSNDGIQSRASVRQALWEAQMKSPTASLEEALRRTEDGAGRPQSSAAGGSET